MNLKMNFVTLYNNQKYMKKFYDLSGPDVQPHRKCIKIEPYDLEENILFWFILLEDPEASGTAWCHLYY